MPSAVEATANLGNVITANRTVTITDPNGHNVGSVNLNAPAGIGYTIAAAPPPTTDGEPAPFGGLRFFRFGGQTASINVTSGNHTISAPITYSTNTTWNVTAAASTLHLTGPSTFDNGAAITKAGPGTVEAVRVVAAGLTVTGGTGASPQTARQARRARSAPSMRPAADST